jgi:ubiquinone/menaquinone biosynthesis C-methylase UbiE
MPTHEELRARAASAYNAAADQYDAPENSFWDRYGARTVERLGLRPGMRVLDVCSGSGASAIPAAQAVGPEGRVIAIDAAGDLLALLRAKARARGLHRLDARSGDMLDPPVGDEQFDAVVCVFGIFFVADMAHAVRELWARVAPGGQLAITTWGPRVFEPANSRFWEAVRRERPDLYKQFNPWDTITDPASLERLLTSAGVTGAHVVAEPGTHPLASPPSWWTLVMGSGYRGTIDQLTPGQRDRVRADNLEFLAAGKITEVEAGVVYSVARKPAEL